MIITKRKDIPHLEDAPLTPLYKYFVSGVLARGFSNVSRMTLKVDGISIKFGLDERGVFFMETARSGLIYESNQFIKHAEKKQQPPHLAKRYASLFKDLEIYTYKLAETKRGWETGFKVCCEVLDARFGHIDWDNDQFKSVHLAYDLKKIDRTTIFPYSVIQYNGDRHFFGDQIISDMINTRGPIKTISPNLISANIRTPDAVHALLYFPDHRDLLEDGRRLSEPLRVAVREASIALRDEILNKLHGYMVPGYYDLGMHQEGVVVETWGLTYKVTEPAFRELVARK